MNSKEAPLSVRVTDDKLIIEIGIETLAWCSASENGGPLDDCKVNEKYYKEWARDVANEINREEENGDTPLNKFLDKVMNEAADNGSQALDFNE